LCFYGKLLTTKEKLKNSPQVRVTITKIKKTAERRRNTQTNDFVRPAQSLFQGVSNLFKDVFYSSINGQRGPHGPRGSVLFVRAS
jgi:hypothetical protein